MDSTTPHLHIQNLIAYGTNNGRGNLLGIQTYMEPFDYASEHAFLAKVDGYLQVAQQEGWLNERTIVVLPEYIGTWLAAVGEGPRAVRARTVTRAMSSLVCAHLVPFLRSLRSAQGKDAIKYSLFAAKADAMARVYHSVFSQLAERYAVTLVAGSIVLPTPEIHGGQLAVGKGPLQNVSIVYHPDGTPHPQIVRKAYPILDELPYTAPALPSELPVIDTPAGRLGVLICADSWYPEPYRVLRSGNVDVVAVPSFLAHDNAWNRPWAGYDPARTPPDVEPGDVGRLSEGKAWLKYALASKLVGARIEHGINVFLRGRMWDIGADGHTVVVHQGTVLEAEHVDGAALVNSWL